MKNHLKQITMPRTWALPRRQKVFTTRPHPSGHPLKNGLALGTLIRDLLQLAETMDEVKKILNNKEVLIDGKRRKDHRFFVGLFDTVSIPILKKQFRVVLDNNGHLALASITTEEAALKLGKIVGKSTLKSGLTQYHLHDGRNIIASQSSAVGDSLLITVPDQKIQKILPCKPGAFIFIDDGKNAGKLGVLKNITGRESTYTTLFGDIETVARHLFVVGEKEPMLTVSIAAKDEKQ